MATPAHGRPGRGTRRGRNLTAGVLLGVGTVAFVDEVIFHQILHWHHFYDLSTTDVGLVSDGILHAFSWFATVAALLMVASLHREHSFRGVDFAAGWLTGGGFFQLYDGLVQHKLMGIHQVRYGVDLLPYDLAWNIPGGILLIAGIVLWVLTGRRARGAPGAAPAEA